jgi:hypothetical protein
MIIEKYKSIETGFTSHVCMIKLNDELYFTVDVYDDIEKHFLPLVKTFKPDEKQKALEFAKMAISA